MLCVVINLFVQYYEACLPREAVIVWLMLRDTEANKLASSDLFLNEIVTLFLDNSH